MSFETLYRVEQAEARFARGFPRLQVLESYFSASFSFSDAEALLSVGTLERAQERFGVGWVARVSHDKDGHTTCSLL